MTYRKMSLGHMNLAKACNPPTEGVSTTATDGEQTTTNNQQPNTNQTNRRRPGRVGPGPCPATRQAPDQAPDFF
jgi:hypothetical protein